MTNYLIKKLGIPKHLIFEYRSVPIELSGNILYVAMSLPFNIIAIDDFWAVTGLRIEPVAFEPDKITQLLQEYEAKANLEDSSVLENLTDNNSENARENETVESTEIISFSGSSIDILTIDQPKQLNDISNSSASEILEYILYTAVTNQASDVHIEPQENHVRVRQRLDGMLREIQTLPMGIKLPLISRIKILAQLDIAEKRLPQDGRIPILVNRQHIDLRISIMPTITGEKCVLRLLYKDNRVADLNCLGFTKYNLERFNRIIRKPHGMVLLTGPTGSGKTTTLYAALRELSVMEKNIITIEDPMVKVRSLYFSGIEALSLKDKALFTCI